MHFSNPQVYNQVMAALEFWVALAEVSKRHPSRHPQLCRRFERYNPMTIDEIKDLIADPTNEPRMPWGSAQEIAEQEGVNYYTLRREIERQKVRPIRKYGQTYIYDRGDLFPCVRAIQKRAEEVKRGATNQSVS